MGGGEGEACAETKTVCQTGGGGGGEGDEGVPA